MRIFDTQTYRLHLTLLIITLICKTTLFLRLRQISQTVSPVYGNFLKHVFAHNTRKIQNKPFDFF